MNRGSFVPGDREIQPRRRKARRRRFIHPRREHMRHHRFVFLLRELQHIFRPDIARDDHGRVVGRVVVLVEIERVCPADPFDFGLPSDHRAPIGMGEMQCRLHLLFGERARFGIDTQMTLLQHNIAFGVEIRIRRGRD